MTRDEEYADRLKRRADAGKKRGPQRCPACGGLGHNRRTCKGMPGGGALPAGSQVTRGPVAEVVAGTEAAPPTHIAVPAPALPGRIRKSVTCRTCNSPGHNARGCPTTRTAPSTHADRAGRIAERARLAGLVRTPCAECGRSATHDDDCSAGMSRCTRGCGALLWPRQVEGHECEPVDLRRDA